MKNKALFIGLGLGTLYGLCARLLIDLDENDVFRTMTIAFIFLTPFVIGAVTVYFGTERQRKSWPFRIMMPWTSILAFLLVSYITLLEAALCVVMLLPIFMLCASLGGVVMGQRLDNRSATKLLSVFFILPFISSPIESRFANPQNKYRVETKILIDADKESIWNEIISVDSIHPEEIKPTLAHIIGIPKPISSKLNTGQLPAVRLIKWEKGIRFRETVSEWTPNESFSYDVAVDTIPTDAIDKHVQIGGEYFSVQNGGYRLESHGNNKTALTLFCDYRISSKFNFYGKLWADYLLDDFQFVILNVVKHRCEQTDEASR